jgi:putative ABC transport system permease protein
MSVFERTREFGVLRAMGWPRGRVVRLILGESLVLSGTSIVIGALAAWLLVIALSALPLTQTIVRPALSPIAIAFGAIIALFAGLGGALYPAYHGASIPAVEALRYE